MEALELKTCVVILLLSVQGISGKVFTFPDPVRYDHSCGLENLQGNWSVNGTLKLTSHDLFTFDPQVIIRTDSHQICTIDLSTCSHGFPSTVDVCYCTSGKADGLYNLFVRRRPRTGESGEMLQAAMPSRDILNPTTVSANIGILPDVYDSVSATYQIDDGQALSLRSNRNVYVPAKVNVDLNMCVDNLLGDYTLTVSLDGQETTTTTRPCVRVIRPYDFSSAQGVYPVKVSYQETGGCGRAEVFTIFIRHRTDNNITVDKKTCIVNSPYLPDVLPEGICKGDNSSCPREVVTLSNGKQLVCDTETDGGGWVVIQRRMSADVDFYLDWQDYQNGFGDLDGNFWYGLEDIHRLCNKTACEIRFDLGFNGKDYYATYDSFGLSGGEDFYRLHISGYSGTAGGGMAMHTHDGQAFSTKDADHDVSGANCAIAYHGGWWYEACHSSNLNGLWSGSNNKGLRWSTITGTESASYSEMKVRRKN